MPASRPTTRRLRHPGYSRVIDEPAHAREHELTLRGGQRVLVRAVCPDDKQRLAGAFDRLSPESRYRRLFTLGPSLRANQLRYLTEIDHHAHEALVAIDPRTGQGLGVARFVRSADDPAVAEVAVAVVDDWQGRGLATALVHELSSRAREEGVERFSATVLADNAPVFELVRALGNARVTGREPGVIELLMELPAEGIPETLGNTLRVAAAGQIRVDSTHPR